MVIEYSEEPIHKKHRTKIIVFGIFLIVLFILVYTSFYGLPSTGNIIKNTPDSNNSISVSADLTIPSLLLDGEYRRVLIAGGSDSFFYIGDQKLSLANSIDNYIILTGYSGKISFDENIISELKGKVTEVSVNGVSVMPKSKETVKIYLDKDFYCNSLKIDEGVFIKKLNYKTSGAIKLENQKTILNLNNDDLTLKNFQGDLELKNNRFIINGYLSGLEIKGAKDISIS